MNSNSHAQTEEDAYTTPKEDFSVKALKDGYHLGDAVRLHEGWSLNKFLDITESGAYSYFFLPEFMPHAVIRRDGPVLEMAKQLDDSIGKLALPSAGGESIEFAS